MFSGGIEIDQLHEMSEMLVISGSYRKLFKSELRLLFFIAG